MKLASVLGLVAAAPGAAQEPDLPVTDFTLENGMRFVVLPRRASPTVAFITRFEIGGANEHLGVTGVAHLLEHLLFKGTTTVGTRDPDREVPLFGAMDAAHDTLVRLRGSRARDTLRMRSLGTRIEALEDTARQYVVGNEFDAILTRAGAQGLNATTTNDATSYFVELPANRAELWFVMEADRMQNPVFREFYTERDVVMEERRMRVESEPSGALYEAHLSAAYRVHPYGVPVVGYMSDLENLGREMVDAYYRRYYGPNNAIVTVVGDVDVRQVERWARAYFANIPPSDPPPPILAVEPVQNGERRVEVVLDAQPQLRIGWHVPDAFHPDAPAIVMTSALLTGGRSTRLYHSLVQDDRLATAVFTSLGPGSRYPQLFQIDATPRSPHTPAEVEEAIYGMLDSLATYGPDEDELDRIKNSVAASTVRRLQSNLGLAFQLSESVALFGDWRETFRVTDTLRNVTTEDVRRVVSTYLTAENRTVATIVTRSSR
ncbi:MAG: insulinase family protein [Gemmatimonadota bacterium]|nr:insulinase family protein [Gemmatimonadota bacterium]